MDMEKVAELVETIHPSNVALLELTEDQVWKAMRRAEIALVGAPEGEEKDHWASRLARYKFELGIK